MSKIVTGTVMLSKNNGEKSFLVNRQNDGFSFFSTETTTDETNMGVILKELKKTAAIDLALIDLVELVSINLKGERTQLFVFEMTEEKQASMNHILSDMISWENSKTLREMMTDLDVSSTPVFEVEK
ncbi:hypothetical protein G7081_04195 [Vagococcus coleopterorum]|uniref:Uncharacterized protein n=1 Tax=Vagococcus coleopterorum TaxID=2714946 RepID=A0A6G8AN24_9ENTE|nr:hypothetical protein [Vagococcus coleopterorum]QIL46325.1 hypothetical protein G7081_04195 [Vagococcus coleopterorum]